MNDDEIEVDWDALRRATTNLTELIWTYHRGLVAAGFTDSEAFTLTMAYQQVFLEGMQR